jgi:hypothetical protein
VQPIPSKGGDSEKAAVFVFVVVSFSGAKHSSSYLPLSPRVGEKRSEDLKVVTKSKEHVAEKTVARASSFRTAEERKREKGLPSAARRRRVFFFFDVFERHSNVWRRRRRRHEG